MVPTTQAMSVFTPQPPATMALVCGALNRSRNPVRQSEQSYLLVSGQPYFALLVIATDQDRHRPAREGERTAHRFTGSLPRLQVTEIPRVVCPGLGQDLPIPPGPVG